MGYLDAVRAMHKAHGHPNPWEQHPWLRERVLGGLRKREKESRQEKVKVTARVMNIMFHKVW